MFLPSLTPSLLREHLVEEVLAESTVEQAEVAVMAGMVGQEPQSQTSSMSHLKAVSILSWDPLHHLGAK